MRRILFVLLTGLAITLQAREIAVSSASKGVLKATGMEPGTNCTIEWTHDLRNSFTNVSPNFENVLVDSNGMIQVKVPLFFRINGIPKVPDGMVPIPAGTNSGTDPDPDSGAYSLTVEAFNMDAAEVTKAQWDTVYNWAVANGYSFVNAGSGKGTNHPVHSVNWYDCVKWCNARSEMDGKTPCYSVSGSTYKTGQSSPTTDFDANGYRLPTNDEWEYAARGGVSSQRFPWGNDITHNEANYFSDYVFSYDKSSTRGSHPSYNAGGEPYTSPVGEFPANGYGLYDMAGNVKEWSNAASGLRGGSWADQAPSARCASLWEEFPTGYSYDLNTYGFRCVSR
ncbi:MAG: formylglycine-generating enzyme family protein [Kiritimatiellaceae bacterium]|nr:formylglycine-generating enzyme family protein [Kiritimatiellaceae bacterium]